MAHQVKLTDHQKSVWFQEQIDTKIKVQPFTSEDDLVEFVRTCRKTFKNLYGRDVPGSFIRRLLNKYGVNRAKSESSERKKEYMFNLMDDNMSFRHNKPQLRKAVETHFGEKFLGIVFDELWDEYQSMPSHPPPRRDVDIHGQESLFG